VDSSFHRDGLISSKLKKKLIAQSGNAHCWKMIARQPTTDVTWRFHLSHHSKLLQNNTSMVKLIMSAWNVQTNMKLRQVNSVLTLPQNVLIVSRLTKANPHWLSSITPKVKPISLTIVYLLTFSQMLILKIVQFRHVESMLRAARIIETRTQESGSGLNTKDSRKFNTLKELKV
jgi:hypothetical protein